KTCFENFRNPSDVEKYFVNSKMCLEYLEWIRWGGVTTCPHCNENKRIGYLSNRAKYKCYSCRKFFTVTTGTIFHSYNSKMLPLWFKLIAFWIRNNVSSYTLEDYLGLPQKTCWKMQAKLRYSLSSIYDCKLQGIVEIDEAYIGANPNRDLRLRKSLFEFRKEQDLLNGITAYKNQKEYEEKSGTKRSKGRPIGVKNGMGKTRNMKKNKTFGNRTAILGLFERGENGRKIFIALGSEAFSVTKEKIYAILEKYIDLNAIVISDDARHYSKLIELFPNHKIIKHKIGSKNVDNKSIKDGKLYVRYEKNDNETLLVTTNNIEGRWKYIKSDFYGVHCGYSKSHMQVYLMEAAWRNKKEYNKEIFHQKFDELLKIACQKAFKYKEIKKFTWTYEQNPKKAEEIIIRKISMNPPFTESYLLAS
ncbi:MAG: hypothetical protein A3K10_16930, partial [Bacteroidetes bacterium RIFCSPLOWO2_12_FULL_31_6]